MLVGIVGFSGGIYLHSITRNEIFDLVSQIGLLTLILAWGKLACTGLMAR
jgi:uncharacterized membrane protein YgdD (TMEM256/DUF423 family)